MVKNEAIEEFVQAIQQPQVQSGTTYSAIVARIDDEGVVWVNLAGSDKETPTASVSAEVEKGDVVTVEWRNNKLYIAGNYSNPSAGMVRVQSVENVSNFARSVAESANQEADSARITAENARNAVAEIEDDISDLSTRVATAEGDVDALEGDISALGGRVSTVEGDVTTLEGNVSSLGGRVATAESTVNTLEGTVSGLTTRVNTAEGKITTAEGQISTIQGNITSINGAIDGIESDVSGLTTRVGTAEGKVTTLEGKVSTAEGNITRLEGRISTAENDISAVEGDITSLQGRVATAEDDIDETLNGLAIAQDVIGTINWITEHGAMTRTTDTQVNPNKVYFEVDPNGIYVVGTTHYSVVENPVASGLSSYYELSVDEAVSNYVASHLALTNEGLYVAKDNSHWKVLVGDDGVYIIDGSSGINKIVASYSASVVIGENRSGKTRTEIASNGMQIYRNVDGTDSLIANIGYGNGNGADGTISTAPYYTFGKRGGTVGNYSVVEGYSATWSYGPDLPVYSQDSVASGFASHSEGSGTVASGPSSHAEGARTTASYSHAHAEGYCTIASGGGAHAEGYVAKQNEEDTTTKVEASGLGSHAEGLAQNGFIEASGTGSHAEGYALSGNIVASAMGAHAEGRNTTASGNYSHAEGASSTASGSWSHSEGESTVASAMGAHAEGRNTTASDSSTHAEGYYTTASEIGAHAEGTHTVASGDYSHAEGYYTTASSDYSHSQGKGTEAVSRSQTVLGEYNVLDTINSKTSKGTYAVIVGNGDANTRANALTVDWTGNVICSGTVTDGSGRTLLSTETDPTVPSWAKASTKPSYTASEVGAVPTSRTVNGKALSSNITLTTSDLTNDSGYLTSETDPTVPSWAKASTKPSYTASEISGLIDMFYPVGSYYETSDTTFNPNTAWGGTWSLETEGQVHVSAGSNYSVNGALTNVSDGGSTTHTLTEAELPSISGSFRVRRLQTSGGTNVALLHNADGHFSSTSGVGTSNGYITTTAVSNLGSTEATFSFGSGNAHEIMQPYIIVNRWHRTA